MIKRPSSTYLDRIKAECDVHKFDLAGTTPPCPELPSVVIDFSEANRPRHLTELNAGLGRLAHWPVDQIAVAPGASQALFETLAAVTRPGDAVIIESPTYEPIIAAAQFLGLVILTFARSGDFARDLAEVRRLATRARALVITNPNCPTGRLYTKEQLRSLGAVVPDLIVDETYLPLFSEGDVTWMDPRSGYSIGGLSKSLGLSGLRLGWVLTPPGASTRVTSVARLLNVDMPTPSLQLGGVALREWTRITAGLRGLAARNRELTLGEARLSTALMDYPFARGHFFCLRIPNDVADAETFVARLRAEDSLHLRSGGFFGLPRHVRVSVMIDDGSFKTALDLIARRYHG